MLNQGDWSFSQFNKASEFDSHVREQLPWYDLATEAVAHIARHYIPENGVVYDIGASTGNIGNAIKNDILKRNATFIPIEKNEKMAAIYDGIGDLIICDAIEHNINNCDLCICFLSLMFMSPQKRYDFIYYLYKNLNVGGALIIVDKFNYLGGYISIIMHRLTLAGKVSSGANSDAIIAKELSLIGVQRPLDEDLFLKSVPNAVEFFRFGEFRGFVVEK